nr:MAG TPA: hypothetical protein [Caudoviricetes sp.]
MLITHLAFLCSIRLTYRNEKRDGNFNFWFWSCFGKSFMSDQRRDLLLARDFDYSSTR